MEKDGVKLVVVTQEIVGMKKFTFYLFYVIYFSGIYRFINVDKR